ncbi:MAG: hypothetical protein L6R36_009490, partial [Xanthoria steineri]
MSAEVLEPLAETSAPLAYGNLINDSISAIVRKSDSSDLLVVKLFRKLGIRNVTRDMWDLDFDKVAAIAEVDRVLKDDIEKFRDCVDAIEAGRESRGLWRCLGGAEIFPAEVILSS